MTVKELRDALAQFPDDAPVAIQGTSVAVHPQKLVLLSTLRSEDRENTRAWAFEGDAGESVVVMTEK